ncbi:MAG TPA: hypothetical protein VLD37_05590 [Candidatus Bilamarchaeum sp.]|nr:hypothetical protein [Candidatus Bilamarchaeum sp.]
MRTTRKQKPPADDRSAFFGRTFPPGAERSLRDEAISLLNAHSEPDKAPSSLGIITERDVRNAIEVLKGQVVKDDQILRALVYTSVSSPYPEARRLARDAIEKYY